MGGTTVMALQHYIGGKLTGLTADFPPSLNYPNLTTFIDTETFIEYILVAGVWQQIGAVAAQFPSMYESFNELTVLNKQHFVEWFSGAILDSIWNITFEDGVAVPAMADEIDGGFQITTSTAIFNAMKINFNNRRHYNFQGCVCIAVAKTDSVVTSEIHTGFVDDLNVANRQIAIINNGSSFTNLTMRTADASALTDLQGDVPRNLVFNLMKIELTPTACEWSVNDIIQTDKTTTLPTVKLQPYFRLGKGNTADIKTGNWRYYEAYNT